MKFFKRWAYHIRYQAYRKIPPRFRFKLLSLYKTTFNRKGGVYYGQRAEDIVLRSILREKKGFYVDVGAHHPFMYSNTYLFYKMGWNGINIDTHPEAIKLFNKYRNRDINLNFAAGEETAPLNYYSFSEPAYNTIMTDEYERVIRENDSEFIEKVAIQCKTLADIFDEYLPENTEIDFLDIDVQGNDFEVLQSNNWSKYKPKVVIVESLDFDITNPKEEPVYQFMVKEKYKLYSYDHLNLIFLRIDPTQ